MTINIGYEIGDIITVNGVKYEVKGVHIYVDADSNVRKTRIHIGNGKFITIENY